MNNKLKEIKMLIAGECGLVVEFGTDISPEINILAQQLTRLLKSRQIVGIIEVIQTYRSVMINFDPLCISRSELLQCIKEVLDEMSTQKMAPLTPRVVHIPVCYGGVFGPDLEFVARHTGLSVKEVIRIHTSKPYLVYMLGFNPGFPYLGGMPDKIAVPRLEKLREKIPAGSVGIGRNQTGFYPIESPGGWRLIGRTPIKAFKPMGNSPFLLSAGDYLHFVDITIDEYFKIRREVEVGTYVLEVSSME